MRPRRLDPMAVLGLATATACALAFVDWLAFARMVPLPRGTHSMLGLAAWLARSGDPGSVMHALRVAMAAGGIATSVLAALIFLKAAGNAPARQVAWALLAYAAFTFSAHYVAIDARYSAGEEFRFAIQALSMGLLVFLAVAVARFLLIFPRPVDFDSIARSPWFGRSAGKADPGATLAKWMGSIRSGSAVMAACHRGLVDGRLLLLAPIAAFGLMAGERALRLAFPAHSLWWAGIGIAVLFPAALLLVFGIYPMAIASTRHLYRNGSDAERRRVAWLRAVMLGAGVFFFLVVVVPILVRKIGGPNVIPQAVDGLLLLVMLAAPTLLILGLAFAVLYGGALDPRVAVTRATLWTVLGVAITLLFLLLERFVAVRVVDLLGMPKETGLVLAGGVIAATFVPLRRAAERAVTRLADRYLPIEVVADGLRVDKTVAITDLSGYTALAARDEPQALMQGALLKRQADRIVGAHGGTLVKSMGDAVMLTFTDPRNAVNAVTNLHRAYPPACEALGMPPLPLHTALHSGEIVESHDGDIYGQTVNVCARLVDAAKQGEIVVSDRVREALGDMARAADIGERSFKNVPKPVRCYRLELREEVETASA